MITQEGGLRRMTMHGQPHLQCVAAFLVVLYLVEPRNSAIKVMSEDKIDVTWCSSDSHSRWSHQLKGTLNVLSSGIHYGWSSPSLPKLYSNESHISLTEQEISWIPVPMQFGGLCGAILTACFINKVGRKWVILSAGVLFAVSSLMIALARVLILLLMARFIAGMADGITYSSVPIYIVEVSDPRIRGFLLSGISVAWCSGVLFMNTVGSYVSIPTASYISLLFSVLFLVTFSWMPETPYHLIMHGKLEKARKCLKAFKKSNDVETELVRLITAVNHQKEIGKTFIHLFTVKSNRRSLLIMLGIKSAQQCCGFTCIMFYAQTIFEEASNVISPKTTSIIYFSLFLISTTLCSVIVEKIGRKPLLIFSIVGTGISIFILASYFYISDKTNLNTVISIVPVISFLAYISFYAIGLHTVGVLVVSEIFPLSIRSIGVSSALIYYEACSAVVVQVFQMSKNAYGLHVLFYIYSIFCVLGLIFIIFCVPETTGITLEEIESNLKDK